MQNKHLFYIYLGMIAAIGMLFFLMPVKAHDGHHGLGHHTLHAWYETLKQPGTGISCCNNQDCRPTEARVKGEHVEVLVDGDWTKVPPEKILNTASPDLGSHVCAPNRGAAYPKGYIFCAVIGGGV